MAPGSGKFARGKLITKLHEVQKYLTVFCLVPGRKNQLGTFSGSRNLVRESTSSSPLVEKYVICFWYFLTVLYADIE